MVRDPEYVQARAEVRERASEASTVAVMSAADLRAALGADAALQGRIDSIHAACSARILRYAPKAPDAVATEALVVYAAWIYQSQAQSRSVFQKKVYRSTSVEHFC